MSDNNLSPELEETLEEHIRCVNQATELALTGAFSGVGGTVARAHLSSWSWLPNRRGRGTVARRGLNFPPPPHGDARTNQTHKSNPIET
jgi:hypothetical protein